MKLPWQQVRAIAARSMHRGKVLAVRRIPKAIGRVVQPGKTQDHISNLMDKAYKVAKRPYKVSTRTPQNVSEFLRATQKPPAVRSVKNLAKLGDINRKVYKRAERLKTAAFGGGVAAVYGGLIAASSLGTKSKRVRKKVRRTK